MPVTIDATVGGTSANSYVTLAAAETYFEAAVLSTAWDAATDDQKNRALVTATATLDREEWKGVPADSIVGTTSTGDTQALQWPRSKAGYLSTIIPEPIKRATYKLAYSLLDDGTLLQDTGLENFENVKIGPLDVTPRGGHAGATLPEDVVREIEDLLDTGRLNFRMVRA